MTLDDRFVTFDWTNALESFKPASDLPAPGAAAPKAISSPPAYHSLEEFSHVLSYYERPNRTRLLQAVYDRSCGVPAPPAPPPAEVSPPVVESATSQRSVNEPPVRSRDVRFVAA